MGQETEIAWTDHTFNPWWGCTEVSPGCDNCYARVFAKRVGQKVWGKDAPRRELSAKYWTEPLKWDRAAAKAGVRRRVFCASMADVFEGREDQQANRLRLWALIRSTPHLDWLLLTKRPGAILKLLIADYDAALAKRDHALSNWLYDWTSAQRVPANVWVGCTVEDQKRAERIEHLLKVPAVVRFLSCEPLLERVDLGLDEIAIAFEENGVGPNENILGPIGWVIVGGESGHGARPFDLRWARDIKTQCARTGVAFFFKQAGTYVVGDTHERSEEFGYPGTYGVPLDGLDDRGRWRLKMFDSKGGDLSEIPADLRIREMPTTVKP